MNPLPLTLALFPAPVLRAASSPIETFDRSLRKLAEALHCIRRQHGGAGLAAPQVGLRQHLFVCELEHRPFALTNLEIQDASEPRDDVEGCLSLPGVQVNVRRPERIRVTGYDLHGQRRSFGAVGPWARVIQHELDHLNGVLICDYQHPASERCSHCPLELPAVLVEGRKHQSRPRETR
jgi:peptide deformylase